jgi:hypothetical protein
LDAFYSSFQANFICIKLVTWCFLNIYLRTENFVKKFYIDLCIIHHAIKIQTVVHFILYSILSYMRATTYIFKIQPDEFGPHKIHFEEEFLEAH